MGYGYEKSGQQAEQDQAQASSTMTAAPDAEMSQGNAAQLEDAGLAPAEDAPGGQERLEAIEPGLMARYDNALDQHQAGVDDCVQRLAAAPGYEGQVWDAIGEADAAEDLLVQAVDSVVQSPWDAEVGVDPVLAEEVLRRLEHYEQMADRCAIWAEILETVGGLTELGQFSAVLTTLANSGLANMEKQAAEKRDLALNAKARLEAEIWEFAEEVAEEQITDAAGKAVDGLAEAFTAYLGVPAPVGRVVGWAGQQLAEGALESFFSDGKPETTLGKLEGLAGDAESYTDLAVRLMKEGTAAAGGAAEIREAFGDLSTMLKRFDQASHLFSEVMNCEALVQSARADADRLNALANEILTETQPFLAQLAGVARAGADQLAGLLAQLDGAER